MYLEHAQDVIGQWLVWREANEVALVVVTATEGGGVRMPGALMAVSAKGERCGYISGGCIDADVVKHARQALRSSQVECVKYGTGSPFIDMPLPCGGAIDICIIPCAPIEILRACHDQLISRQPVTLRLSKSGELCLGRPISPSALSFTYTPKLRLRIAGRGADSLALARLATASGIQTELQLRDRDDIKDAQQLGIDQVSRLARQPSLPARIDDPWTAVLLAFHDGDWEEQLIGQALHSPAFYIGAVGSKATHARRCERLRAVGFTERQISRIRGPAGLIPSMRDASMLAVSILAEIAEAFQQQMRRPPDSPDLLIK